MRPLIKFRIKNQSYRSINTKRKNSQRKLKKKKNILKNNLKQKCYQSGTFYQIDMMVKYEYDIRI